MGAVCVAALLICIPLGLRWWSEHKRRAKYYRAVELHNEGKLGEALPLLDDFIALMPDEVEPRRIATSICLRLKDPERAESYLEGLLKLEPDADAAKTHFQLGMLYLLGDAGRKPDLDKAIAHLAKTLKQNEQIPDAQAALGIAYSLKRDYTSARSHLAQAWAEAATREPSRLARTARLWQIADMLRRGDAVGAWVAYRAFTASRRPRKKDPYRNALALALAVRVNSPAISTVVRRLCIRALSNLPKELREKHGTRLHALVAAAHERLGEVNQALSHYRQAYRLAPTNPTVCRNLAHVLFEAAATEKDKTRRKILHRESLALYQQLLGDGQLSENDRKQLSAALATLAWSEGREEEAVDILKGAGDVVSPLAERMKATLAARKRDYKAFTAHLQRALELDKNQADVTALLERLQAPPEVRYLRINRLSPYDARPIISAGFRPRALPVPIPPERVKMKVDERPVQAMVTRGECFYRPDELLSPGEHGVELSVTDTLGLSATKSLKFTVKPDTEPPAIVGISPTPKSATKTLEPIISFRCTDPSGINESSLSVVFTGHIAGRRTPMTVTVVERGVYRIAIKRWRIKKGARVSFGAVNFQFSKPLREGECRVRVKVSDMRRNFREKSWSFKCTKKSKELAKD